MLGLYRLLDMRAGTGRMRFLRLLALTGGLVLVLTIDNKASWAGVAIAMFFVLSLRLDRRAVIVRHARLVVVSGLAIVFIIVGVQKLSPSLDKFARLAEAWEAGEIRNIGKVKATRDVLASWQKHPHMALLGSGPATFYSRSGRQFYDWMGTAYRTTREGYLAVRHRRSAATEGVYAVSSAAAFYLQFYRDESAKIFPIGSGQTDLPFCSSLGLLGETGLIGTILYLSLYLMVGRHLLRAYRISESDENRRTFIACTLGFMVYTLINSTYNSWLETTRMTTMLWTMIPLSLKYCAATERPTVDDDTTFEKSYGDVSPVPESRG